MSCVVKNCHSRILPSNRGYSFPANEGLKKQWLKFCGLSEKTDTKSARVCMKHFKPEDYENSMKFEMGFAMKRYLKQGAVPSINMAAIKNMELYMEREQRKEKRENKKIVAKLLEEHTPQQNAPLEPMEEKMFEPTTVLAAEGEDPLNENILPNLGSEEESIKKLRCEIDALRKENHALKRACNFELKAKEENKEKLAKITSIYEHNLNVLNKRLVAANDELTILRKINNATKNITT